MCGVLGMAGTAIPTDGAGRMDLDALAAALAGGGIGTVVATARDHRSRCSRSGARDRGARGRARRAGPRRRGVRRILHCCSRTPGCIDPEPWNAVPLADSVVVDPHKHGLQPYGCGAVLFRDPSVGRFYVHDSPYTYFTSDELHLGEISLECSRSGAAAAALWLTLQLLPLTEDGLGAVLAAGRRAALALGRPDRRLGRAADLPATAARHRHLLPGPGDAHGDRRRVRARHDRGHDGQRRPGVPRASCASRPRHWVAATRR